jgi:ABC-type polysaccharide/polyol phosphate transport system ATPase subunit
MSDIVIRCEGLGKSYSIGHQGPQERYTALRDVLARQARGVWNATRRALRGQTAVAGDQVEEFWALKDVSFDIKRGEVVGIIGRNGAGKSTLLKILSRITEPTEGRVTLRGRVASLLEVGTGFHPELTGRENVFLNGAILGMTRSEIKRKFDEIVAFAEVEKFLDTPVKRYSSGMYVRLAFAVAAHLEPEILVVDEVLAVGDAEFQKKCLGKMRDVSIGGRTVLFVSHNMAAVAKLCNVGILLNGGRLLACDTTDSIIDQYTKEPIFEPTRTLDLRLHSKSADISVDRIDCERNGNNLLITISVLVKKPLQNLGVGYRLKTRSGNVVATQGALQSGAYTSASPGHIKLQITFLELINHLTGGMYLFDLWISRPGSEKLVAIDDAVALDVSPPDPCNTGHGLLESQAGPLCIRSIFNVQEIPQPPHRDADAKLNAHSLNPV